ncbi:GPR1/FUN34/YaaH family transporter [Amycolatopsis thermophila]|uniref:Succinate-acetate transporter protein n=1 Tax=Amycolatopsis thermophila TaxID=206084 RepID=A0ABU0EZT9_9PSEU|nr:GPR1/FUN34/YaaH family transporter [Amycolatopsis thermophila]MDQ0380619.1 succinate-acetate transporter protein [Amycolatopsis thermophila]
MTETTQSTNVHPETVPAAHDLRAIVESPGHPAGVVVGAGGDPLILALPIFAVGSLALGVTLTGLMFPVASLGAVIPVVLLATGLGLVMSTIWAALLGQTMVAGITGTFGGFWLSFGGLLLGLTHNWFGVDPAAVAPVQELFFVSWACLFLFLLVPCLRLPAVYPAIVGLVVATLALAAASAATGNATVLKIAGYVTLAFAFLGFSAFVNVGLTAMGARKPFPPLGRPLMS